MYAYNAELPLRVYNSALIFLVEADGTILVFFETFSNIKTR